MMSIAELEECVDELGGQTGRLQLNQMVLFAAVLLLIKPQPSDTRQLMVSSMERARLRHKLSAVIEAALGAVVQEVGTSPTWDVFEGENGKKLIAALREVLACP